MPGRLATLHADVRGLTMHALTSPAENKNAAPRAGGNGAMQSLWMATYVSASRDSVNAHGLFSTPLETGHRAKFPLLH